MTRILLFISFILILGCVPAGTVEHVNMGDDANIEVIRYYYTDGNYVYISRFKNEPNILTTTWNEPQGKYTIRRGNVVIFENDSIQVILKQPR